MRSKNRQLSNFSNAIKTTSSCFRPEHEAQIVQLFAKETKEGFLARGNGLSYGDCCLNDQGIVIDTTRFNHLLSFDEHAGLLVCQGSIRFADLFLVNPHYIPPVIPGTLRATVAGGIANDVHGKNNHQMGCFGQHLGWFDLQLGSEIFHCSPQENQELFYATIAGLGLTGIIKRVAIKMRRASHFVAVENEKHLNLDTLLDRMQDQGCAYDYQVAWLDLLNEPRGILSLANHCEPPATRVAKNKVQFTVPKLPLRLVSPWLMKQFNRFYFKQERCAKQVMPLVQFNNPLDSILHWNRLYGKKGLLQFQAIFATELAPTAIEQLLRFIRTNQATPTLAVLKYFIKAGTGLLSFAQPGFTLAIDFINNQQAHKAISAMNEWITQAGGKIYLAKDLLLTKQQFNEQYPAHQQFSQLLSQYKSNMRSDLSKRLGLNQ